MTFLKRLRLSSFRSFEKLDLSFDRGINCIVGQNGIGKTNLLEAIFFLSTGRSFRTSNTTELIRHGDKAFYIEADFEASGISQKLILSYDGKKKVLKHNGSQYAHFTPLLGLLPSVIHSPSDICLITGLPKDRRRFLNLHIAQKDAFYATSLARYAKALAQRNAQLKMKTLKGIEVWEEEMAKAAIYLMEKRKSTLLQISEKMRHHHIKLQNNNEMASISYAPSITKEVHASLWEGFREKEVIMGHTLFGPHRDDLEILLQEKAAKNFASEGQKRTLISAVKLSEYESLDNALFLLDDFGIHLDPARKDLLKGQVSLKGQTFITAPEKILVNECHFIHLLG